MTTKDYQAEAWLLKVVLAPTVRKGLVSWEAWLVEAADKPPYEALARGPHSNCRLLAVERARKWAAHLGVYFEQEP